MRTILIMTATLLLVSLVKAGNGADKEFMLVEEGKPAAVIMIPENAPRQLRDAIDFFNAELSKCGVPKFSIVQEAPLHGNHLEFVVQQTAFMERDKYEISFPKPRVMRINCTATSARWALNHLLDKAGVRYLYPGPDGAHYPLITSLSIPRDEVKSDASYRFYRGLYAEDVNWMLALNCEGGNSYQYFNHAIDRIFPLEKYTSGEWLDKIMPLRNGQRESSPRKFYWEPCYSHPATTSEAIKNICSCFEKHPKQVVHSLTVNDGYNTACECDLCRETNRISGKSQFMPGRKNYSEVYYKWVNQVAKGVTEKYPDKYFCVLAYAGVIDPPSFKLHPNVLVIVAFESYACIDPDVEQRWKTLIREWREKAAILGIWEYGYGIAYFTLPRIYFHQQVAMLRFVKTQGGESGFVEGIPSIGEGPKRYLYLKLFYDVNLDVDEALRDWYNACVGSDAAPYLANYYEFWEKFWTERATQTNWFQSTKFNTYTGLMPDASYMYALEKGEIAQCRQWLETMIKLAEDKGNKRQLARAKQLMLSFEFYEASAYACGAEMVPVSGNLNKTQALELAAAIPEIVKFSIRRAEIAKRMLKEFPSWWGGTYRNGYTERFEKSFATPKFPEVFSLLTNHLEDNNVRNMLLKSLNDEIIPVEWKNQMKNFADIASGKIKNILPDGSFETSRDNWNVYGKLSRENAASGEQSLKINFAENERFMMARLTGMKPGRQYYLSAKILIPADYPPNTVTGKTYILSLDDNGIGRNYYIPQKTDIVPGQWITISSQTITGVKSTGFGLIHVIIEGMKKGDTAFVDDVVFVELENRQTPIVAAKDEPNKVIDHKTFEEWMLVDAESRKNQDKHVKLENNAINISAESVAGPVRFFYPVAVPCKNGGRVEFTFDAAGSGQGQIGFFTYEDEKWTQTDGTRLTNFAPGKNTDNFKFNLPVRGEKIKAIRVVVGAMPGSKIKFSNLKIRIDAAPDQNNTRETSDSRN